MYIQYLYKILYHFKQQFILFIINIILYKKFHINITLFINYYIIKNILFFIKKLNNKILKIIYYFFSKKFIIIQKKN